MSKARFNFDCELAYYNDLISGSDTIEELKSNVSLQLENIYDALYAGIISSDDAESLAHYVIIDLDYYTNRIINGYGTN